MNRVSHIDFENLADTGDILLFQTKNVAAKIQRLVTRSEYDHIALILRYNSGKVVLYESLRDQGVGICEWSKFLFNDWNKLYEKVIWRRLNFNKSSEFLSTLDDFVSQTIGKPFKINASKLFRKRNDNDIAN